MTDQLADTALTVPARYCPLCQKRLAAMNHGIRCFTCADVAQERVIRLRDMPQQRVQPSGPIKAVPLGYPAFTQDVGRLSEFLLKSELA